MARLSEHSTLTCPKPSSVTPNLNRKGGWEMRASCTSGKWGGCYLANLCRF